MGPIELIAGLLITSTLVAGTAYTADQLEVKMNATVNTGVSDASIQCGLKVLNQYNVDINTALNDMLDGTNISLTNALIACGANATDAQREAATGEPDWLIQQLKEM